VGLLGFTPVFTAFVFGRATIDAVEISEPRHSDGEWQTVFYGLGAFLVVVVSAVLLGQLMTALFPS
jgi:hypothetical protein